MCSVVDDGWRRTKTTEVLWGSCLLKEMTSRNHSQVINQSVCLCCYSVGQNHIIIQVHVYFAIILDRLCATLFTNRVVNNTSKKYWRYQYQYTLQKVLPITIPIQFSIKYCNTNISTFVNLCKLKWFSHNYILSAIYAISLNSLKISCIAKKSIYSTTALDWFLADTTT